MAEVKAYRSEADLQTALNAATSVDDIGYKGRYFYAVGVGLPDIPSPGGGVVPGVNFPQPLLQAEADALNTFITSLGADWTSRDSFAHFGLQNAQNALWDMRQNAPYANTDAVHTPGSSFAFNGSTAFINTGVATNLQDDALIGAWIQSINVNGGNLCGVSDGATFFDLNLSATDIRARLNVTAGNLIQKTSIAAPFLVVGERTGANDQAIYENGISGVIGSKASLTPPTSVMYIGARNIDGVAGNFFNGSISSFVSGDAVGFDQLSYYNNLVILNAALAAV